MPQSSVNQTYPESVSGAERIAEIGEILALGLMRLRARQSTHLSAETGDSFVDCLATPSGHGGTRTGTAAR
jgi:hypothetical protein